MRYVHEQITLAMEQTKGIFADGSILRNGVKIGSCVYDRKMSHARPIDDVDDVCYYDSWIWRATVGEFSSPPFVYHYYLCEWVEDLFNLEQKANAAKEF